MRVIILKFTSVTPEAIGFWGDAVLAVYCLLFKLLRCGIIVQNRS